MSEQLENNKQNQNITEKTKLNDLNQKLKTLNKELKTTKNKTRKKEILIETNALKKQINSLIKYESKVKRQNIFKRKPKKIKIISYQLEKKEFKSSLLKMMRPYSFTQKKIVLPLIILLGLACSLSTLFFVQNTGLFSMGISGVLQSIARIANTSLAYNEQLAETIYNVLFWSLYFIMNIPLLIFSYFKISKKFTFLTALYIGVTQLFGLAFSFIPGISDVYILGEPMYEDGVNILKWNNANSIVPLFFYATLHGVILGVCYSFIYMFGSSTGGTDIPTFYYAKVKNTSISKLLVFFNLICLLLSTLFGYIIPLFINGKYTNFYDGTASSVFQMIFSPNFMLSTLITFLISFMVGILFPKNKVIKINIYTQNIKEIQEKLFSIGYQQSLTINNTIGGYSWTAEQNIETICTYFHLPDIISCIRSIDSDALVVIQKITDIDGKIMVVSK